MSAPVFTLEDLKRKGYATQNRNAHQFSLEPQPPHRAGLPRLAGAQSKGSKESPRVGYAKRRVRITMESFSPQPFDCDNLAFIAKPIIDALRYEGLLIEDDPDHMELYVRSHRVAEWAHARLCLTVFLPEDSFRLATISTRGIERRATLRRVLNMGHLI